MDSEFSTIIQYLADPIIDGQFNPFYRNPGMWKEAKQRFGAERVEKAVRDYRQDNPRFKNWRY